MRYSHVTEIKSELLDCPMCGAKAKVFSNELGNLEHIARCTNALSCGARGSAFMNRQEAISAWNRRTQTT